MNTTLRTLGFLGLLLTLCACGGAGDEDETSPHNASTLPVQCQAAPHTCA